METEREEDYTAQADIMGLMGQTEDRGGMAMRRDRRQSNRGAKG